MKNVADIYALSPMQQLMLFHTSSARRTDDVLFNQIVYEISGPLDIDAYHRAWQLMVDRHAALRTIFIWQDGKDPLQVVRQQVTLPWFEHDWRELAIPEKEQELDELLVTDRDQGFDLLRAPLMRVNLVRLGDNDFKLIWSSHHLIIDRWCIGIIFEELNRFYEAELQGSPPSLAPAPPFRDYIAWLSNQDESAARAYWREALRDVAARSLPLKPGRAEGEAALERKSICVDGDDWARLRRFALDNDVTTSTLISAAWAIVLGSSTSAADALFGLTVSGRPAELTGVERTVGCFINNVPLRVKLDRKQPIAAWLMALQEQQLNLQSYEYASLVQIQAWSGLKKKGPLFDTLLVLQTPVQSVDPAGITVTYAGGGTLTGYPVSLSAVPDKTKLSLALTIDRKRVPQAMFEQMLSALQRVILAMPVEEGALLQDVLARAQIDIPAEGAAEIAVESAHHEQALAASQVAAEQTLTRIWAELLSLPRVSTEDRFYELGGDSVSALQMLSLVEQRIGKRVPISLLFGDPSLAQMAQAIGEDVADLPKDPVLVPLNIRGTRPPIFFVHGIFGGLIWLTNLLPLLESNQPAYGLQSIGFQPDCEPDSSINAMAARYVEAIRRVQPSGPYHLCGFCFGGVVAYEMAWQLEQLGERTALLAIIDGYPSRKFQRKRPLFERRRLRIIRESAPYWVRGYKEFGGWRLADRILYKIGLRAGIPQDINTDAIGSLQLDYLADFVASGQQNRNHITKTHKRAAKEYVPQVYGGKVTVFSARLLGVGQALVGPVDPQRGWSRLAKGGVLTRSVKGSHAGSLTNPFVSDLAAQLKDMLRSANGDDSGS